MGEVKVDPQELKAMTPVEVDNILVAAMLEESKAEAVLERNEKAIKTWGKKVEEFSDPKLLADDADFWNRRLLDYKGRIETARGEVEATLPKLAAAKKVISACDAEYNSRPWQRYWLTQNANGHLHKSQSCSTLYPTTVLAFIPDVSGFSNDEIIENVGETACDICFPNMKHQKPKIRLELPDKKAARLEREQAKAEREAKKNAKAIMGRDGEPVRTKGDGVIKTESEAQRIAVQHLAQFKAIDAGLYQVYNDHIIPERKADTEILIDALAYKRGTDTETQMAELSKKAEAKMKRDYR